jgi:small redox-active disulfide protein 2
MRKLQVLGTGCPACEKLATMVEAAAQDLQLDFTLEKTGELDEILSYGVAVTPALVVDGEVKFAGGLPTPDELRAMLSLETAG